MNDRPERVAEDADLCVDGVALDRFCRGCLSAAGVDEPSVDAATRAMMHASWHGIDSHGVRLLSHYIDEFEGGRLNKRPRLTFVRETGATAVLDADNGHGARGAYAAMERAVAIAEAMGVGAVAVTRSGHFGAAGAFALLAAEAGLIGLTTTSGSAQVRPHDGARKFHGTNPIAFAAPVAGARPWLLDMATSAAALNKIHLYGSLGRRLPPGAGSDASGRDTDDPAQVAMLAPLGGVFGYKGAGLAGMVDILSAMLTGMALSFEMLPMFGTDMSMPRNVGAFMLALRPSAFVDQAAYDAAMRRYLDALRASPALPGRAVMAAGDKEWAEAERRIAAGIPLDRKTWSAFEALSRRYGIALP